MRWTLDWLKDYLDTDATADGIADTLTRIGLEVEDIEYPIVPIAAKIVECDVIPDTHLHLLRVDDGTDNLRQVVCGAPNARCGLVSALALPGCKIGDMEIKSGKIRGVLSDGMMCSGKELGINNGHEGIIELDEAVETIGESISRAISHQPPVVFDAGITPNRPDYLAVRGIARDLAASGIGSFQPPTSNFQLSDNPGTKKAVIENYAACPVYCLCEIKNIKMVSSSSKIASRLAAIGITPRNSCIDATNYVCYDIGQPMHCFDADEIVGDITIRNAATGEKFTDLFGAEHELISTDLVIADDIGILALAGIIGGARGMTTDATKNIVLESAYFASVGIRKTAKRLGLQTDSSYRFERGIDPTIAMQGIAAAVKIIHDTCGGEITDTYMTGEIPREIRKIEYRPGLFKQKTGIDLPVDKQKEILELLGFGIEISDDKWVVVPTPARVDVVIPENIVAELIRIYGYENIKTGVWKQETGNINQKSEIRKQKSALAVRGFNEIVSYKFGDSKKESLLSDRPQVHVINPIIDTFDTMRNSLVQGALDVIANNDRFRRSNLALFEFGAVFDGNHPGQQHDQLIIARTGIYGDKIGVKHGHEVSIYDIREDLLALFPGAMVENDTAPQKWSHPFRAGRIIKDGAPVARFAELHPVIAKKFGIKTKVVIGLIDNVSAIPEQKIQTQANSTSHQPPINDFPDFPLITRDFAFIVDNSVSPDKLFENIMVNNSLVYETNIFDVFDLGDGKKSVALEIVIQPTGNMSDTDLMDLQNKIISEIESKFDAKIRDK